MHRLFALFRTTLIATLGQRSELNDGLNNNLGFVVGDSGVILIDSDASRLGAQAIERAVAAARDMEPMDEVLDRYSGLPQFKHLEYFQDLHRANMNGTYLEFEQL